MAVTDFFGGIFNPILDPIFGILLKLPPFWGIFVITLIVTLITTLIYKKMTDQEVLKTIKEDMKELQKKMKEHKDDVEKLTELQKQSMQKSMIQMQQTMKPMLITMLPILIIFAWFSTHLAFNPLLPDQPFNVNLTFKDGMSGSVDIIVPNEISVINGNTQTISDNKAGFILKGQKGEYNLKFLYNNNTYNKDILITDEREYKNPDELINKDLRTIKISNEPIKVLGLNWFWAYIILAVILNTLLRKILKIH